jgi:hypothetical protein
LAKELMKRAEQTRQHAQGASEPWIKETLEDLAAEYEQAAYKAAVLDDDEDQI